MKFTGELLKSERIKKNISQQDVAHALKLSVRVVNAIEEGNLSELPAKVFVRGFVKSYSDFLKLDTEMILNQFQEEMGMPRATPSPAALEEKKMEQENASKPLTSSAITNQEIETINPNLKISFNKSTALIVIIIVVGLVLASIINGVINKYKNEGLASETEISEEVVPSAAEGTTATTSSDPALSPLLNPATESSTDSSLLLTTPAATTPVAPTNTEETKEEQKSETPVEPEEAKDDKKVPTKYVEVVLEALKDTTISYAKRPSKDYKNFTLKQNTLQIIKSNSGLHLKIQNGNAVQITVNGVSKGPASKNDEPVEFNF